MIVARNKELPNEFIVFECDILPSKDELMLAGDVYLNGVYSRKVRIRRNQVYKIYTRDLKLNNQMGLYFLLGGFALVFRDSIIMFHKDTFLVYDLLSGKREKLDYIPNMRSFEVYGWTSEFLQATSGIVRENTDSDLQEVH